MTVLSPLIKCAYLHPIWILSQRCLLLQQLHLDNWMKTGNRKLTLSPCLTVKHKRTTMSAWSQTRGGNCDTLSLSPPLTSELFSRQKSPHKAFIWFAHCITLYNHISLKTTQFPSLCSLSWSLSYKMISHTLTSLLCSIVNSWSMRFCYTTHTPLLISARQKRQNGVVEE